MKAMKEISRLGIFACEVVFFVSFPLFGAETVTLPGHQSCSIKVDDMARHYIFYLPGRRDSLQRLPLVIMLHGGGGTAAGTISETGWSTLADKKGFAVAYPDATPPDRTKPAKFRGNSQTWNDGSDRFGWEKQRINDVAFIRALIEDIVSRFPVDRKRIYVTGFSNGASMTFRVGAELSDCVAAIAPVAGACWLKDIQLKRAVPMCYITGTDDPLNPLKGGRLRFGLGGRDKPPVQNSIDRWVKAISAPVQPASTCTTNGVTKITYGPGRNGSGVTFITVEGLGHIWAGGENKLPGIIVGKPTDKLNACEVIWLFFSGYSIE